MTKSTTQLLTMGRLAIFASQTPNRYWVLPSDASTPEPITQVQMNLKKLDYRGSRWHQAPELQHKQPEWHPRSQPNLS
ncbi:hypothetical protein SPLC1_S050820 [Arthrospira platensis C1]|nr:hypothetical protein SPLC1_S050820 [Arthrospira platensis C1]